MNTPHEPTVGKDTHETQIDLPGTGQPWVSVPTTHPEIPLNLIDPNPYRRFDLNPLDPKKIEELRTSIRATGFWDNVVVRPVNNRYQLAYGHHRLEAVIQELGPDASVRVIIRDFTDEQMLRTMLDENRATVILTGRSVIEAVAAARLHFKTDDNLRENIANLLNYPKERVKDALSILYAIEDGKISKMVLNLICLSQMTLFRHAVKNRPSATIERQEKLLSGVSTATLPDARAWLNGNYDSLGQTQKNMDDAKKSREETKKTGLTKVQRLEDANKKSREAWIQSSQARLENQVRQERKEEHPEAFAPQPNKGTDAIEAAARKAEKAERNARRFEHVNRIIDAGVAALKQAGEFTDDTQFALDWLRKVNTPPTPPKVSVTVPGAGQQEVPEPTPKVVDASSQQESESKARRLEDYLTAIAETPHASPYQICRRLGAGEVPIFDKYNRELRKCAERAGLQWDKENKTWVKITMPFGLSCNPPKST